MLRSRGRPRNYLVERRIAAGGMGEVYKATAEHLDRPVAVKRMLEHAASDEDMLRLFLRELMVVSTLEHHNVVEVLDVGQADDELFLVMEFVDGPTLAEVLEVLRQRGERPSIEVALAIATQVAQGLAHAHERARPDGTPLGIVHRDIAPENVLITRDGIPKLVDFGLAKVDGHNLTQPGIVRGRPRSLAPEQARGDDTDARTDVFALGTVLFELTSGQRLYPDEAVATLLWRVAAGDYEPVGPRMAGADPDLVRIVERAVAVAPDDRFRSARQLERELYAFQAARGIRVSSAAVAELVASTWEDVLRLRKAALGGSRGELEGTALTLPPDDLERLPELAAFAAEPDRTPLAPDPRPSEPLPAAPRWQRPEPQARPDGWDRVIPVPDAPARTGDVGRSARFWWLYGLSVGVAAMAAFLGSWWLGSGP